MGTAIAKRSTTAVTHLKSISEIVVQINAHIYDAQKAEVRCIKLRLKAGQLLLQLRQRIEAGEEGDVGWWEWFDNLGNNGHPAALLRSRKDAERLMRIASAEDPEAALLEEREKDRDRKRLARSGADKADVRSKSIEHSKVKTEPEELPNYDPADPRGWYKDEGTKVVRRRAWLYMASDAKQMAESFLAEHGHRAIAIADAAEIDSEIIDAVEEAARSWAQVHAALMQVKPKRAAAEARQANGGANG